MSKPHYRQPLTDEEMEISFREGATDEQIEVGRGTRAECIENAFRLADEHAIDHFSLFEDEADEARALSDAWRLVLWPPRLDPDPRFWAASSGVFEEG